MRTLAVVGSLSALAASVVPAWAKVSKASVAYQDSPKDGHDCANCAFFEPPTACKTVDSPVAAKGWCRIWAKNAA
jgi:hypothetical protein